MAWGSGVVHASNWEIGDVGATALAAALEKSAWVPNRNMKLFNNLITEVGATALAAARH